MFSLISLTLSFLTGVWDSESYLLCKSFKWDEKLDSWFDDLLRPTATPTLPWDSRVQVVLFNEWLRQQEKSSNTAKTQIHMERKWKSDYTHSSRDHRDPYSCRSGCTALWSPILFELLTYQLIKDHPKWTLKTSSSNLASALVSSRCGIFFWFSVICGLLCSPCCTTRENLVWIVSPKLCVFRVGHLKLLLYIQAN